MTAYIFVMGFCLLSFTCNSPTGPGQIVQPGRRDYVWTVDTLSPSTMFGLTGYGLEGISGSSPTDVWTGGSHITPQYNLFHYDGTKWTGWSVPIDIWTIFSFAPNEVWTGGSDGRIWHFDGKDWSQNFAYKPPNAYAIDVQDIYGINPDNVYAVGSMVNNPGNLNIQRGFVLHYDGTNWKEIYVANYQSQFVRVRVEKNQIAYLYDVKIDSDTNTQLLYQYRNGVLRQIYSDSGNGGFAMVDEIAGDAYFIISHDVCRYTTNYFMTGGQTAPGNFVKLFSINDPQFDGQIYGRSENDLFVTLYDGIAQWNGTDVERLFTFSNNFTFIPTPAIFDKEVFFCVSDALNKVNMVAHGKLTN